MEELTSLKYLFDVFHIVWITPKGLKTLSKIMRFVFKKKDFDSNIFFNCQEKG